MRAIRSTRSLHHLIYALVYFFFLCFRSVTPQLIAAFISILLLLIRRSLGCYLPVGRGVTDVMTYKKG
jgi:hypothetical protein